MADLNLGYFMSIVRRDHPDWPVNAVVWQASRMLDRHPFIEKAFYAGKQQGRELRQRLEAGLGLWWDELEPLSPDERGFVLALIKNEIQPREAPKDGLTLESVAAKRKEEAWQAEQDALALDWRFKSSQPDKRVVAETTIAEARKPKVKN